MVSLCRTFNTRATRFLAIQRLRVSSSPTCLFSSGLPPHHLATAQYVIAAV
jgi:hypothetical protein